MAQSKLSALNMMMKNSIKMNAVQEKQLPMLLAGNIYHLYFINKIHPINDSSYFIHNTYISIHTLSVILRYIGFWLLAKNLNDRLPTK